ncbi:Reticulon [Macleaya cordata]|uniref:Reticulon n=1 Tax=Macleaya cordata TaxID=56857 RepID=A0A200RDL6_MACCD|nr:Reticulon [Macleaya cordata]
MDALQQSNRFMRPSPTPPPPPPPHMADPQHQHHHQLHHHQQQQQQQQQQQPPPPQGHWFSGQFQYHASQPPPPPPPHQQQMWVSHPDHQPMPPSSSYPPPPPNSVPPYPAHPQPPHNPYLPPPPPAPHPYSHPPQAYPQTWENPNLAHQQSWEHPGANRSTLHTNEEDWAARAREWAAAKAAMENQHTQSQFAPVGRPEEHNHVYHDQLRQAVDPRYTDPQQPPHLSSIHQHFPVSSANSNRPPVNHLQESTFNSGVSSSYVSDGHLSYPARDGAPTGDSNPVFPQGSTPTNSSIYQQEVPSSYSSLPGNEGAGDQNAQLHRPSHLPVSLAQEGLHYMQPTLSGPGRSASLEHPHFLYGDRSAESVAPCDRPLEFTPRFSREHDPHPQASYTHLDPSPPVVPGVVYPPIPPVPSGLQFDPSFAGPPIPGHAGSMFGQIPGQNFRPSVPTVSAPFGLGAGITLHPAAFGGDANGGSNVSDRPKKASVPNWLREEIIKKKVVMASSSQEYLERDPNNPIEEDDIDKSFTNGGQADHKSTDSSRLSEDEDDDEDDVEAAKTAAINQEIKRVLTEVLLKVTDELFDEIATKVLSEDDVTVEVDHSINPQRHISPPPVPATKASAKVLIPVKSKESEADDVSEKSGSGSPGDILGLASYASDNDDDEVIESFSTPTAKQINTAQQQIELSENKPVAFENGSSLAETEGPSEGQIHKESEHKRTGPSRAPNHSEGDSVPSDNDRNKRSNHENISLRAALNGTSGIPEDKINVDGGKMPVAKVGFESKDSVEGKVYMKPELPHGNVNTGKSMVDDSHGRVSRSKADQYDEQEKKRNSADKGFVKEAETAKLKADEKHSDFIDTRRQDQRHDRKDKTDDRDGSKEKVRDRGTKTGEKAKASDSRKSSKRKDDKRETEKLKKAIGKEDGSKKRERAKDEKEDRSRQRSGRDSGRHKRRRSSSISSRGRNSKENSVGSHADESSDGASADSRKRKPHPRKRSLSPSPTRSRRSKMIKMECLKKPSVLQTDFVQVCSFQLLTSYKFRALRIASILNAGILPTLLSRARGEEGRGPIRLSIGEDDDGRRANFQRISGFSKHAKSRCDCSVQMKALESSGLESAWAIQVGLWSVWLCGFILIALSLYASQRLPSLKDHIKKPKLTQIKDFRVPTRPNITIFSAPNSFTGLVGARQMLAVRSWLALSPELRVVLFGQDPHLLSVVGALGSRVLVEPNIDFTFLGTPFLHSMLARSQASISDISVLIDPETILLPDFMSTLNFVHKLDHDWLLVATSPNVSQFPFYLDEAGQHWLREDGERIKVQKMQEFLAQKRQWSRCEGKIIMAWNTGELPLHAGVLPPFLYGKGIHNHWIINEALSSDFRFVFDASEVISSFYLDDPSRSNNKFPRGSVTGDMNEKSWEYMGNSLLGALYGSLYFRGANFSNKLVKLIKCDGHFLFIDTEENIAYPYRDQDPLSLWKGRIMRSRREKKRMDCVEVSKSLDRNMDCSFKEQFNLSKSLSLQFSFESLLPIIADKDRTIILGVAGHSYRDMLLSWVCRLRHLMISNFVICALDHETYQFSILQGLPVFEDPLAPSNISFNDCHFGTKCFQSVTKVKSRLVLQMLKMGYNVLLSDVDVYWFENPLPYLRSFGPAVLVAQSDEYNETGPINMPRRLNSGFYFARSDAETIAAIEKVVKHASTSPLSEQPSFYDMLCGEGGRNRVGDDRCLEPETNLTVHFLDRNLFPNGAYQGLWEKANVKAACKKKGCIILHNNWISGRKKKLERQVLSGLWVYDVSTRMCLQSWHGTKLTRSL